MIDLETMGKHAHSPIVALGAVFFDIRTGDLGQTLYMNISLSEQMKRGATPDASTIIWWLRQSYAARQAITEGDARNINSALLEFESHINGYSNGIETLSVWGNGSSFDNVILRNFYERANYRAPWRWDADRDVRTIVQLGRDIGYDPKSEMPFSSERHNALADGTALLNPKNIKLNKYGNLPRNKLSQLKGKENTFIGELNGVDGVWQRKKSKAKKSNRRLKRSANGTRRPRKKQRAPKLLIRFGDALPVEPVLGYQERAQQMAQSLMPTAINQALSEAIRTAK
ncbi:3'-5' exonuclease [Xenorhabdus sp. Sc-CR9]|uniref:3'-5' exonuclease n=1 Tax=Xenorhabdus sp. Sc-CR9 TaxID=2584468 RepID=UPI003FCC8D27